MCNLLFAKKLDFYSEGAYFAIYSYFRFYGLLKDELHAVSLYMRIGFSDRPTDDRQPFKNPLIDG